MMDLDEIVESFKLSIDRIAPERLAEIVGLLDAVPRARLNQILDRIENEKFKFAGHRDDGDIWVRVALERIREEIQK